MKTIRVLHVIVQPVLVIDDGIELSPGPQVKPINVKLSEFAALPAEISETLKAMQDSIAETP